MYKTIQNILIRTAAVICFMVILCCCVSSFEFGAGYPLSCFAVLTALYLLLKRNEKHLTSARVTLIFAVLSVCLLAVQIWFVKNVNYYPKMSDPKILGSFAQSYAEHGDFRDVKDDYFTYTSRYPNTWGMIYLQVIWLRIWRVFSPDTSTMTFEVLNIILLQAGAWFTFLTGRTVFRQHSASLLCGILTFMMPVPLMFTATFHSDTVSIFFAAGAVFFFALACHHRADNKKCLPAGIASALFTALGNSIKGTMTIMMIALIITLLLTFRPKKALILSAATAAAFLLAGHGSTALGLKMGITTQKELEAQEFPVQHWIMMGLNENGGGHHKADVDLTRSIEGKEEKRRMNKEVIEERLDAMTFSEKLERISIKMSETWFDGSCKYDKYLESSAPKENVRKLIGDEHIFIYAQGFRGAQMIAMLAACIACLRRHRSGVISFAAISVAGLIMFLVIWEDPPRYTINFIPLYLLLMTEGIRVTSHMLLAALKKSRNCFHREWS